MGKQKAATEVFILRDEKITLRTIEALILATGSNHVMQVTIAPYKANRSLAQNRLMWMWHTQYAVQMGSTKVEEHVRFKRAHCLPILVRDDEEGRLTAIVNLMELNGMLDELAEVVSSTLLSVKQMAEALTEYSMQSSMDGVVFTHPEDVYYEAIGGRYGA